MKNIVQVGRFALVAILLFAATLVPREAFAAASPSITTPPQSQSVMAASNATFTVVASGQLPLSYQWLLNGIKLTNSARIAGATAATLVIGNVISADGGNYTVTVTNSHGSITSSSAVLTVLNPPYHYVNISNTSPAAPYATWSTAAINIQDAVDVAQAGHSVFVTNGTYTFGNRLTSTTTNCVVVTNAISLIGLSGSSQVVIDGGGSKRCVYLGGGAMLTGFTLRNGATTESGAGVYCASGTENIANCTLTGNTCGTSGLGGGAFGGTLTNCTVAGNTAIIGGGANTCTLNNCVLSANSSAGGGGAYSCTLNDCVISNNFYLSGWGTYGGGAASSTLNRCTLIGNSASSEGGGADESTLSNCVLIANSCGYYGGAVSYSTLYNCVLSNNVASQWGGGAYGSTLYNCLLTGGNAFTGGGAKESTLVSCLVSNNTAGFGDGAGVHSSTLTNCVLIGNIAGYSGGGANGSSLINCQVLSNAAPLGGGVSGCFVTNSILKGNTANNANTAGGGGANGSSLYNCLLTGNTSVVGAAGALQSTLVNCTVSGNSANGDGGGVNSCNLTNSIVYFNNSPITANYTGTNYMSWCCTTPLPNAGSGRVVIGTNNTSAAPQFANFSRGNFRLYPGSAGIDAGNNSLVPAPLDLDGNPRIVNGTVDMGAYEFQNSPFIEIQPLSQTVPYGQPSVSFNVVAFGPGPLSYQWQFNGTNIPGATNTSLTLALAQYSDAGNYSVFVTNSYGAALSSNAVLTVVPPTPPGFVSQPADQTVPVGTNITLAASATGAPAPAYRWYFNGTALSDGSHYSGTGSSTLQILNVQTNDTGGYFAVATNIGGAATSFVASVTVLLPPSITSQPANQMQTQGSTASFMAAAAGSPPFSYQWLYNGNPLTDGGQISGATTTNLTISNLQFANGGNYALFVTNPVGVATSTAATLTVFAPPAIVQQPTTQIILQGSNVLFSTAATGTQPIGYKWFFNNVPLTDNPHITGSGTASLAINAAQTNDAGNYFVIATNAYGAATSSIANLSIVMPVVITQQPSNQIVAVGSNFALSVTANGTGPLGYQWYLNNVPLTDNTRISGSATSSLTVSNAQTSDSGNYTAVVTNLLSAATSSVASVSVLTPPSVVLQPKGRSTPVGFPEIFNASVSGASPFAYQWQLNGTNIPGATNLNYTNASVAITDFGGYQLVVTNTVGSATSAVAMLTLGPVAAWGDNRSGQALPPAGLSNVVALAASSSFSLALKGDGTVVAWGSTVGTNVPAGLSNVVAISVGSTFGLAVRSDGTVASWGSGLVTNVTSTASNVVLTSGSINHALALREEGTVSEWGFGGSKITVPSGLTKITSVADGYSFGVASRSDGSVVTWGSPTYPYFVNFSPGPLSNVVSVAAGLSFAMALKSDGHVFAWGSQAGVAQLPVTSVPADLTNAVAIAAGSSADQSSPYALALRSNGLVRAWGANTLATNIPLAVSNVVAVAAGSSHALALVAVDGLPVITREPVGGTAFSSNQFTLSAAVASQTPVSYGWSLNGTNIPNATNASYVISNAQPGDVGLYQLNVTNAVGVAATVPVPVTVIDSLPIILSLPITNSVYFASPLVIQPAVTGSQPMQFQWQLGGTNVPGATDANFFQTGTNVVPGTYTLVASNAFGSATSNVIVKVLGPVVVWGTSPSPAGGGSPSPVNVPTNAFNAIAISAGHGSSGNGMDMALKADGTAVAWNSSSTSLPVPANWTNLIQIVAGYNSMTGLGLKNNGTVVGWGGGIGLNASALATLSNIVDMEIDTQGSTFLRSDGSVTRLGGSGSSFSSTGLSNVVSLAFEDDVFFALRSDGSVYSLGTGSGTNNVMAIAATRPGGMFLKRDGSVYSWPTNLPPAMTNNAIGVASSVSSRLVLKSDGTVQAVGTDGATNVPPGLANVSVIEAGADHGMALLTMRTFPPVFLSTALDTTNLVVSSKGSSLWFGQTNVTHDGFHAAQSGPIGSNTASSMRMWVAGPVTVSFWWKVSSETDHDFLRFSAGNLVLTNISGETGWQQCTLVTPPGNQLLQWTYSKDASGTAGQDAGWVDQVVITPIAPSIVTQPVGTNVLGGANVTFNVLATGTPPLTYRWRKDGNVISSGLSSNYSLLNVTRSNSGVYSVIVTNVAGSMTSSNAVLAVHVLQHLSEPIVQPDGTVTFTSSDIDGGALSQSNLTNLHVETSSNLVDWVTLPNALTLTNGTLQIQDPAATIALKRFYRIVETW
ncbi:immunoglobulin domain-containing protein [Pedosphaera parvula]|uniref:Immunoglobulin I-set domain protein n=1 Tax=Pedosphaera parvula (strain Ellin514) TaxID=320771 RepID=B9XGW5_PEDPL|nr:immunoglobulin domain-containing protein [Pedosphaera parvula]EEF60886.1 Immunoglobulin I-set domain protein [Pedosphaera parvula Ellin514]